MVEWCCWHVDGTLDGACQLATCRARRAHAMDGDVNAEIYLEYNTNEHME